MSPRLIKWTLFTALLLSVPALLFLVQAVMFLPAIFFAAGVLVVLPKLLVPGHAAESAWFLLFLGVHLLVYGGLYYLISLLLAKAISLIKPPLGRAIATGALLAGLLALTFLPVYGGGGHGPMTWGPLSHLFAEINRDYGSYTAPLVYGGTLLLFAAIFLFRRRRSGTRD